jgi:phosphonate transport system substrate-binding protein
MKIGRPNNDFSRARTGRRGMLWVWLAGFFIVFTAAGQEKDHPFRFGYSTLLIQNASENDSRAAMRIWVETLVKEDALRAEPTAQAYKDLGLMSTALQNGELDGVAVTTSELLKLQEHVKFNRFVFGVTDGSIFEEYLLLVHARSGINGLEDLRGRSINLLRNQRMSLALPWLDTLLLEKGLKPTRDFCGQLNETMNLTKTVLPVFFRQTDICLVTRKGFNTMIELNPQVGKELRILATSVQFATGGFFFRAGYPKAEQDRFVAEVARVQESLTGQQILTVFQMDRLNEYPASVLDSAIELINRHQQLLTGTNRPAGHTPGTERLQTYGGTP